MKLKNLATSKVVNGGNKFQGKIKVYNFHGHSLLHHRTAQALAEKDKDRDQEENLMLCLTTADLATMTNFHVSSLHLAPSHSLKVTSAVFSQTLSNLLIFIS